MTNDPKFADRIMMEDVIKSYSNLSFQIDNLFKEDPNEIVLFLRAKYEQLEKIRYGNKRKESI